MNRSGWSTVLVLALAVPSTGAPAPAPNPAIAPPPSGDVIPDDGGPTKAESAAFKVNNTMLVQKAGYAPSVAVSATAPLPTASEMAANRAGYAAEQRRIALEFNRVFEHENAYEDFTAFSERCQSKNGCDSTATGKVFQGANDFVALKRDVDANRVVLGSDPYLSRHDAIKNGLKGAMDEFQAKPGADPAYETEMIKVSDPILRKILTPSELLQYAERNAASSDSSPYYAYLGKTRLGAGFPSKAREAFDASLERDPNNQMALSGRAEARYELGDFPGAVTDARAALRLNPGDLRALTALKFSEGRDGGAASANGARSSAAGGAAAMGAGDSAADEELARAASAPSVSPDAVRRSAALVVDAKRSLSMGDALTAAETLRQAVEVNPSNAQAFSLASIAYSRLKKYEAAFSSAESGLKLAPRSTALLDSEAFALNHLKDYHGALAAADRALAINPRDAVAYFNRAAALSGLGDKAGRLSALESAAALDPKFQAALDAIRQDPDAADIMYLFPGAAPAEAAAAADAPRSRAAPSRETLIGGGLACLALLLAGQLLLRRRAAPQRPPSLSATVRRSPSVLAGKYEVGRQIGAGGMGVVYEGRDRSLARPVAIKRMREEIRWDPKERDRFVAEAKLVANLRHPHIVEINAIVEHDGEIYLIFEFVKGRTLHEALAAEKRLGFARARQLFRGVVAALDYAQGRGVVHRDLKPANIMLDADGRARVMDFGIARLTDDVLSRHSRTQTGTVVGTPAYMAPEQELGRARKESDVFSLAVCLYESLTGSRPFAGSGAGMLMNKMNRTYPAASAAVAGLPPGIDGVFEKALEPDPDKRYASAGALLRALEALEGSPAA